MNYLFLNFKDAGWFYQDVSRTKDFVFDLDGPIKRCEVGKQYKEPITVHQVSNMLHVLFGERPVPSLRRTILTPNQEIKEIALNSWLNIDPYFFTTKKGNKYIFSEAIQTKKSVWNSWSRDRNLLYWERLKQFLGDEYYSEFIELLKTILNIDDPLKQTLIDIIENNQDILVNDYNMLVFLEKMKKYGKNVFYEIIKTGNSRHSDLNKIGKVKQTVIKGVSLIAKLNGKIIVPINDNWLTILKTQPGNATILDGGLVTIASILKEYEFFDEHIYGFTKISEISDELLNKTI